MERRGLINFLPLKRSSLLERGGLFEGGGGVGGGRIYAMFSPEEGWQLNQT